MTEPTIKTATSLYTDEIVDTVVRAFRADPAARWLYPDTHSYLVNFPGFVRAFAGKAFEHDSVYYVEGYRSAALWLPPGVHVDENALIPLLRRTVAAERQPDLFAVLERMDSCHPSEPHWYLPMIGVDPAQQGKGFGSALLKHALGRCDREGKPAYLESSSPKNIPLYRRHGFELIEKIQVGGSPPIFPMIRKPAPGAAKTRSDDGTGRGAFESAGR